LLRRADLHGSALFLALPWRQGIYISVTVQPGKLIAELTREAARYKVAALVVRFETGDDYVFVTDKPSPIQRLEELIAAEGDPIAIIMAADASLNEVTAVVRFLTDFFGDPPSPVESAKVVREFRMFVREHGLPTQ
jgi:hypothetical protein